MKIVARICFSSLLCFCQKGSEFLIFLGFWVSNFLEFSTQILALIFPEFYLVVVEKIEKQ